MNKMEGKNTTLNFVRQRARDEMGEGLLNRRLYANSAMLLPVFPLMLRRAVFDQPAFTAELANGTLAIGRILPAF